METSKSTVRERAVEAERARDAFSEIEGELGGLKEISSQIQQVLGFHVSEATRTLLGRVENLFDDLVRAGDELRTSTEDAFSRYTIDAFGIGLGDIVRVKTDYPRAGKEFSLRVDRVSCRFDPDSAYFWGVRLRADGSPGLREDGFETSYSTWELVRAAPRT
jgi:hypothetical protein